MDRPRRDRKPALRLPSDYAATPKASNSASASALSAKRKPAAKAAPKPAKKRRVTVDPEKKLKVLLTSPKSRLCYVDLFSVLNADTFAMLSDEARNELCQFLPPTAFQDYKAFVEPSHPSQTLPCLDPSSTFNLTEFALSPDPNSLSSKSPELLNPRFFKDAYYVGAARTFQDQLFSSRLAQKSKDKVNKFLSGIHDGTMHAPWKDEVHEERRREEAEENAEAERWVERTMSGKKGGKGVMIAGETTSVKLSDMVQSQTLQVGDVLVYRRHFTSLGIIVEKDAIISAINSKTHLPTVLTEPSNITHLRPHILLPAPDYASTAATDPPMRQIADVASPNQLESGLLDIDGRVPRGKESRPNGNAWKCISVWTWRGGWGEWGNGGEDGGVGGVEGMEVDDQEQGKRGGRKDRGLLFYLRGGTMYGISG